MGRCGFAWHIQGIMSRSLLHFRATLVLLALSTVLCLLITWKHQVLTCLVLAILQYQALWSLGVRARWQQYYTIGLAMSILEALCVRRGIWAYARPFLGGVPLWLPFAWANVCVFVRMI